MKETQQIIEDTLSEVFAIDGRLRQIHDVILRPYDITRIKQTVRKRMNELHNVGYSEQATQMESKENFLNRMVKIVKDS